MNDKLKDSKALTTLPKLTPKQQLFCDEYLIDRNATQAAIRAGYSHKSAKEQGHRQLTKNHIQAYIRKRSAKRTERTEITQDMVVQGLLSEAQATEDTTQSARVSAWFHLGKHLGMFSDRLEIVLPRERVERIRRALEGLPVEAQQAVIEALTGPLD